MQGVCGRKEQGHTQWGVVLVVTTNNPKVCVHKVSLRSTEKG